MKSAIKIGRDQANDIVINEPRISRHHAIITRHDNGTYEVKDLSSSNGTYINGQRITRQLIRPGDKLQVASSLVEWEAVFQDPGQDTAGAAIEENAFAKIKRMITVGSSTDNDLVIEDTYVSAYHAKIAVLQNGDYFLEDLGSSNGSFINGNRVKAKNFSKTDVVKVADATLPADWFRHENLRPHFYREHRKTIWIIVSLLLVITGSSIIYFNWCCWFGRGCNLTASGLYDLNKASLVHLDHEYYYTIKTGGVTYYVGKNKIFIEQTEANTSKQNIFPYGKVTGAGCFVTTDGSVLTSPLIVNPWLNTQEQNKMLREVIASRTIPGLAHKSLISICGETGSLKWIQNGQVNNQQNYTAAVGTSACTVTDSLPVVIRSVKAFLPDDAKAVKYVFRSGRNQQMHNTSEKYYSQFYLSGENEAIKDSFYMIQDTLDINRNSTIPVPEMLPAITEGSPVFNARGELIGIIQEHKIVLLSQFYKQLIHL